MNQQYMTIDISLNTFNEEKMIIEEQKIINDYFKPALELYFLLYKEQMIEDDYE